MTNHESQLASSLSRSHSGASWVNVHCSKCGSLNQVDASEAADEEISCRNCYRPMSVAVFSLDDETKVDGRDTEHDLVVENAATPVDAENNALNANEPATEPPGTLFDLQVLIARKRRRKLAAERLAQQRSEKEVDEADSPSRRSNIEVLSSEPVGRAELVVDESVGEESKPEQVRIVVADDDDDSQGNRWACLKRGLERRRDDFAGAIVSLVVHMIVWMILAAIVVQLNDSWGNTAFNLAINDGSTKLNTDAIQQNPLEQNGDDEFVPWHEVKVNNLLAGGGDGAANANTRSEFAMPDANSLMNSGTGITEWAVGAGDGFKGRALENRAKLAAASGGTAESENAVELGLK